MTPLPVPTLPRRSVWQCCPDRRAGPPLHHGGDLTMARSTSSRFSRSLALPRTPLRGAYPLLRYGAIDGTASAAREEARHRTNGLLDAAVDWGHYIDGKRAEIEDFTS